MDNLIPTLLAACLGSSGLTGLVLALLQRRWAKQDKEAGKTAAEDKKLDAVIAGLKVLTVDRVRYLGQKYIDERSITLEDKENLQDMYHAYKALGGNGHLETVMAEVDRLPVTGGRT